MKRFNLKEYLRNPRDLITRNGRKARVICKDRVSKACPLVVLVTMEDGEEIPFTYHTDGKFYHDESELDLFFAPEEHEGWINLFGGSLCGLYIGDLRIFESKENAEKNGKNKRDYVKSVKIKWEE